MYYKNKYICLIGVDSIFINSKFKNITKNEKYIKINVKLLLIVFLLIFCIVITYSPTGLANHNKTVTCSPGTEQNITDNNNLTVEYELDLKLTPEDGNSYWVGFTVDPAPEGWYRDVYKKGDITKTSILGNGTPPDADKNNWDGWIYTAEGTEVHFYAILEVRITNPDIVYYGVNATIVVHCWSCDIVPCDLEDDQVTTITTSKIARLNITTLSLLKDDSQSDLIYSRLSTYTFQTNIIDTASIIDLKDVLLKLDPYGVNIQILWNRSTGKFSKILDPNNYLSIDQSNIIYNELKRNLTIYFNLTFNWTYPDEDFHDVQVLATSVIQQATCLDKTDVYRVENDLIFKGNLSVKGEDNRKINNIGWVRGGEKLIWSGLTPVYEGTTSQFPPEKEFDVSLSDGLGNSWIVSPNSGEEIVIQSKTDNITNVVGETYSLVISQIPQECDKTNTKFNIKIDGDNVTFSNFKPNNYVWQRKSSVDVEITISDFGGALVNGSRIKNSISTDNGTTWSIWESISYLLDSPTIIAEDTVDLIEGTENLIKWQAMDTLNNGPSESSNYRINVDTQDVIFSDPLPEPTYESISENVEVGITLEDLTSGIDTSTIEYSISFDGGASWGMWLSVSDLNNSKSLIVKMNYIFPNGTSNCIKWRALDIAGNGPTESESYPIIVNTWKQQSIPKVNLMSPGNGSTTDKYNVLLEWILINSELDDIYYDVILDLNFPPLKILKENIITTNYKADNLENGKTYYWTIIPKKGTDIGNCVSGIWSFSVDISKTQHYNITLKLNKSIIELKPGQNTTIKAIVTNNGDIQDTISLNILEIQDSRVTALIVNSNSVKLNPEKSTEFIIEIKVLPQNSEGNVELTIEAKSELAPSSLNIKKSATLNVKILEVADTKESPKQGENSTWLIVGTAVVIVSIIILLMFFLLIKRKK
jgi:hypothetical protein